MCRVWPPGAVPPDLLPTNTCSPGVKQFNQDFISATLPPRGLKIVKPSPVEQGRAAAAAAKGSSSTQRLKVSSVRQQGQQQQRRSNMSGGAQCSREAQRAGQCAGVSCSAPGTASVRREAGSAPTSASLGTHKRKRSLQANLQDNLQASLQDNVQDNMTPGENSDDDFYEMTAHGHYTLDKAPARRFYELVDGDRKSAHFWGVAGSVKLTTKRQLQGMIRCVPGTHLIAQ